MTMDEAREAGRLVAAVKAIDKERRSFEKETIAAEVAFDEELYLPRDVFDIMLHAGRAQAVARLKELGVDADRPAPEGTHKV